MLHLLLQLCVEHVFDFSNSCFLKCNHGLRLGFLVDLLELAFEHWTPLTEVIVELLFKDLIGVHHGFLALVLADVAPTGFDRGHGARVNRVHVRLSQVIQHLTVKWLVIELLRLNAVHDLAAEGVCLLHELGP